MSAALIAGCLWVLVASLTAMLPMRRQYAPGIALLTGAPVLIGWIGVAHGPWVALAVLAAALSMFRRPLIHLARRMIGLAISHPEVSAQASEESPRCPCP